jgi:glycine cleavage system H protein
MTDIRYTKDHEYIRLDGDVGVFGISPHAQEQLGDVVYVELPQIGAKVVKGGQVAIVESVKAASEVYAPASGEIIAVNAALESQSGLVNEDPLGEGWIAHIRLADPSELAGLMDEAAYQDFLKAME